MKNLLLSFLFFTSIFPQQFHSLDGIESSDGHTILLYRLGSDFFPYNPVYKFNTITFDETLIMQAYSFNYPSGEMSKAIWDFEFFPNDDNNFMNVGLEINPDNHGFIARNDSIVFGYIAECRWVDISKQNPQKVFVFDNGGPIRSWDGGYTFPLDSIPAITNFIPIALSDFDDNVMFGFNEDNKFCKNTIVVDTSLVGIDQYFKMLYDKNQFHIYRINKIYGGYALNVSNNKGDAFTWTKTYQSENPIFITIDSTQSGVIFLADGRSIYKSINNGYTFTHYKSLPNKLVGIYKKPNSEILYAATKYKIYEITENTIQSIKQLKPVDYYDWYPLKVGNLWTYENYYYESGIPHQFVGNSCNWVKGTKILPNAKEYFEIIIQLTNGTIDTQYIRLDSLNATLYGYSKETGKDLLYETLYAEIGDTICYEYNPVWACQIVQSEEQFNIWGINSIKRNLYPNYSGWVCSHSLVKGIGLSNYGCGDLTGSYSNLKGCIINGIVYGDTSLTDVNEKVNSIPTEFKLEQNFPNPFNPNTTISWQSPVASWQTIKVYDILGKEVATLVDEYRNAGCYEIEFTVAQLSRAEMASGIYFYQLQTGSFVSTKKMLLLK